MLNIIVDKDLARKLSEEDTENLVRNAQRALKRVETLDPLTMQALMNSVEYTGSKGVFVINEDHHIPDPSQGLALPKSYINESHEVGHGSLVGYLRYLALETAFKGLDKESTLTANARFSLNNLLNKTMENITSSPGDLRYILTNIVGYGILPGHSSQSILNARYNDLVSLYEKCMKDPNLGQIFKKLTEKFTAEVLSHKAKGLPSTSLAHINNLSLRNEEHWIVEALNYLARIPKKEFVS